MKLGGYWEILIAGLLGIGVVVLLAVTLDKGLDADSLSEIRRLEKLVEPALQKAHHSQDGILLQETVQAFARLPGVSLAGVIDKEQKIQAHSRLSLVGQTYRPSRESKDVWTLPLRDDQGRWGTCVFTLSSQAQQTLWRHQVLWAAGSLASLWILFAAWSWMTKRRLAVLSGSLADRDAILSDQNQNKVRFEDRFRRSQDLQATLLQTAVNKVAFPVLLLDQRQCILAINRTAAGAIAGVDESLVRGKAWSDIPSLLPACASLEESLRSPGKEVSGNLSSPGGLITVMTLPDGSGTWVTFFPSNGVVK